MNISENSARLRALIVAAGLSSRMGTLKALLPVAGEAMIRLSAKKLLAAGAEEIVVVTGYRREAIEAALTGLPARFVLNENYASTQMFDSIKLGLAALKDAERIFFAPVDAPAYRTETARALLRFCSDFAVPCFERKPGHPILMTAKAARWLRGYSGEGGLRAAMQTSGLPIHELETDDPGVLLDADTPEEYKKMLQTLQRSGNGG